MNSFKFTRYVGNSLVGTSPGFTPCDPQFPPGVHSIFGIITHGQCQFPQSGGDRIPANSIVILLTSNSFLVACLSRRHVQSQTLSSFGGQRGRLHTELVVSLAHTKSL